MDQLLLKEILLNSDYTGQTYVLFSNDSLLVLYPDQSRLQLSACASSFSYDHPPCVSQSSAIGSKTILQKTSFATSDFKPLVFHAVTFRNHFAEQPFLSKQFVPKEECNQTYETKVINWANIFKCSDDAVLQHFRTDISRHCLKSLQKAAEVSISPGDHLVRISYQAKLLSSCQESDRLFETRLNQHFPLCDLPRNWLIPVCQLLHLSSFEETTNLPEFQNILKDCQTSSCEMFDTVVEILPPRCSNPQLHKFEQLGRSKLTWIPSDLTQPVKIILCNQVLYLLIYKEQRTVLAYLSDGSRLIPNSLAGCYFTHFLPDGQTRTLHLQQNNSPLVRVMQRCQSLCVYLSSLSDTELCQSGLSRCWLRFDREEDSEDSVRSGVLLDCQYLDGIGRFSAYSSGRIYMIFSDRVILECQADLKERIAREPRKDRCPLPVDLPCLGYAKILNRAGYEQSVCLSEPPLLYERHCNTALEWIAWVNCSDRKNFYTDKFHEDATPNPLKELEKIHGIVGGNNLTSMVSTDFFDVNDVLEKTKKFLEKQ